MTLMTLLVYAAVCIFLFALLRIPLNTWTVPSAAITGLFLTFGLSQTLNYYHPYSESGQPWLEEPVSALGYDPLAQIPAGDGGHDLLAWFPANSRFRLEEGSRAEVTFAAIPGQVFTGKVDTMLPVADTRAHLQTQFAEADKIPVLITITDPDFNRYAAEEPGAIEAQTAIYGAQLEPLAVVRKTLLRMSAWMNYLTV